VSALQAGACRIIYTDILRDGMMQGFNAQSTRELAAAVTTPIIASGGVSSLDDLRKLNQKLEERLKKLEQK